MSSRKRIVSTTSGAAGGISPTTGNVVWGPDFGENPGNDGQTFGVQAALDLASVDLAGDFEVQAAIDLTNLSLAGAFGVRAALAGTALGAPFFQGIGTTTQTANSSSVVLTPDTTADDGDFLIVNITGAGLGGDENFTAPSGWTLLRKTVGGGTTIPKLHTYYKFAGAGEASSYTFTGGENAAHLATIMRLTAVDTGTPINVENGATGNTADPVSPSITTTVANCFMLTVCGQQNALTQTYTPPATYTERSDHTGTNVGVAQVTSESATRVQAAAGASGTATHNSNQVAASQWCAHHIALTPGSLNLV